MAGARSGLYDDPKIYDVLHAPGTGEEVDSLEAIEAAYVDPKLTGRRRLWLEPACGSGRYLREAARRGIDTIGFDLSAGMIEYASMHAPNPGRGVGKSTYFVADMSDFAQRVGSARVSLAFNLINTIRHLPSDESMLSHFHQIARVLVPGGCYVVGLSTTAYRCETPSEDVWLGARGRLCVTQVVQFLPPRWDGNPRARSEKVLSHLTIRRPGGEEHRDSTYRLRTYSCTEWESLIERGPLRVVESVDECGAPYPAGDGGYHLFVLAHR